MPGKKIFPFKTFTFKLNKKNATCPISLQVFLQPAFVEPCGHYFEMEEISKWKQHSQNCPCCQYPITKIRLAPNAFNKKLDEILDKNPKKYEDCYFSMTTFKAALKNHDDLILQRILNILSHSHQLCDMIDEVALNHPYGAGNNSILYFFASSKVGREILLDSRLRQKITSDGLNYTYQDKSQSGYSALYFLLRTTEGRVLLLKDNAHLCHLIRKTTLHTIIQAEGVDKGKTAACFLKETAEGKELLSLVPTLHNKVYVERVGFFTCLKKIFLCQHTVDDEKEEYILKR